MGRTGALWGAFEASKPRCLFAHVSGVHQVRRELAATSFVRKDYRRLGAALPNAYENLAGPSVDGGSVRHPV